MSEDLGHLVAERRGRVWSVLLDKFSVPAKNCWFGRGPSGFLLGAYADEEEILFALGDDVTEFDREAAEARHKGALSPPAWPATNLHEDDPLTAVEEEDNTGVAVPRDQTLWHIRLRSGEIAFIVEDAEGQFSQPLTLSELSEKLPGPQTRIS